MKKLMKIGVIALLLTAMGLSMASCGGIFGLIGNIADNVGDDGEMHSEDLKSREEVENALGDNYEITMKYGYASTEDDDGAAYITTKRAGDAVYTVVINSSNDKDTYFTVGNRFYTQYNEEAGKFTNCSTIGTLDYPSVYTQIMTGYNDSIDYETKSSGKFLGRDVTIYKWKESASIVIASVSYEWEYVVDNKTGLILKQVMTVSGSSVEGAGAASACFEVTDIKIGGVKLDDEMAMIAVSDWPTAEDFSIFGVNAVAKIDGEFTYSSAVIEETGIASEKQYLYSVADASVFDTLSRQFYDVGFKKNGDCEEKPLEELIANNEYSEMKEFKGYIGEPNCATDYCVEINLIPSYSEDGTCVLTIKLYNNKAMGDY